MKSYKIFLFFSGNGYFQGHLHYIQVSLWHFIWLVNSISFLQNIHYLSILSVKRIPILPCWCWAWPCDLLVCQNISRQTEHKKRLGLASSPCLFAGYYIPSFSENYMPPGSPCPLVRTPKHSQMEQIRIHPTPRSPVQATHSPRQRTPNPAWIIQTAVNLWTVTKRINSCCCIPSALEWFLWLWQYLTGITSNTIIHEYYMFIKPWYMH